jgi:hypothetical protein
MGLPPTQGDEKRLGPATTLYATVVLSFVIPTGAKRSGGTCGSADLSWECFSKERSGVERSVVHPPAPSTLPPSNRYPGRLISRTYTDETCR